MEYLKNANECLELARRQKNEETREQFLELARHWTALAEGHRKLLATRAEIEKIQPKGTGR